MARLSFDDKIFIDKRFRKLEQKLGSTEKAIGSLILTWRVAQDYYLTEIKGIPLNKWEEQELSNEIIDVGLASVKDGYVFVAGAESHFSWLTQRSIAGKKSGEARKNNKLNKKTALESEKKQTVKPKKERKRTGVNGNERNATELNGANGGEPISISITSNNKNTSYSSISDEPKVETKGNEFIAAYCARFKTRWGANPIILPKDAGIAKRLSKSLSLDKFIFLIDAFFAMPDAWFVKAKHPLGVFEAKLNEISLFADTGEFTTMQQARNGDRIATTNELLKKYSGGKE